MFILKNNRLNVSIAEPNKECVTSRFDRAGIVTQVRLDGKYDFLAQEDMLDGSPSSGGVGLCSEIQCDPLSETVDIGSRFFKIGVGNLLKATDEAYFFMNTYDCDDYEINVSQTDTSITFVTMPKTINGYGFYQEKTISLEENRLVMRQTLRNAGDKEISFEEYSHNFMSLNHKKVNKDYYLTIPCVDFPAGEIKTHPESTTFFSDGTGLSKSQESMKFALYAFTPEQMKSVDTYSWTITDKAEGISVSEVDDFKVPHITVWSVGDAMSPEMFYAATLAPNEETTWTRTWIFED